MGLRNLTVIADTENYIRKYDPDFSIEKIPLDDKATYNMMSKGKTLGVFQFESDGMKNVLRQLNPESIEDLTAVLSLYRPGPMDSIPKYIENRHNPDKIKYDIPELESILSVTYGCIVYQEQVMQVFRKLGGYSLGRADIVRRAMAKKKHDVMKKEKEFFLYGERDKDGNVISEGALAFGISEEAANKIFDEMSSFSSYAFNKAHAAAYSFVAYRTAYLKCHYPSEYFAALMTSMMDSSAKISQYTNECVKMGIKILPPSVNHSLTHFTPDGKNIRFGLLAVKNLGLGLIERLIKEREQNGVYQSFYDFCFRNYSREFNRKAVEGLIKSGALDCVCENRREMLYNIDGVLSAVENERRFSAQGQLNLFEEMGAPNVFEPVKVPEMSKEMRLSMEKEATGLYLTGHPMDEYTDFLKNAKYEKLSDIASGKYPDGKRVTVAGIIDGVKVRQLKSNNLLCTAQIEDVSSSVNVTVFANAYTVYKPLITDTRPVILTGRIAEREDRDIEIVVEKIESIPENLKRNVSKDGKKIKPGLYLRVKSIDGDDFTAVKSILTEYKGESPVYIVCLDSGKRLSAPKNLYVNFTPELSKKLAEILGDNNVKYV